MKKMKTYAVTFGGDYGYKDGAESMILSACADSIILSAGLLLPPPPPCCRRRCWLCIWQQRWQHRRSCLQVQRRWHCHHCYWFCSCFYFCFCFCCSTPMGWWCPTSCLLKLTLYFIVVQPDKYIGTRDNIYIMTTCSTAAPISLPTLVCPLFGTGRLVARIWHVLDFATWQFPRTSYQKLTVCWKWLNHVSPPSHSIPTFPPSNFIPTR